MPSSLAAIACEGMVIVLLSTIVGRSRTSSHTACKMPGRRSAPRGSAPMRASMPGARDRSAKAHHGIQAILVRTPCRAHSVAKLPFHG